MMAYARFLYILAAIGLCATHAVQAQNSSGPTTEDILERYYASNGGIENIRAIHSLRAEGKISRSDGETGTLLLLKKRPNKQLTTIEMDDRTIKRGSDGQESWIALERPNMLPHVEIVPDSSESRFDSLLIDPEAEQATLRLLEPVREGRELLYPVEVTHDDGKITIIYLEARSLREVRRVERWEADGKKKERIVDLSEHTKINNVWFAQRQLSRMDGESTVVEFNSITVNPGIFDDAFSAPEN